MTYEEKQNFQLCVLMSILWPFTMVWLIWICLVISLRFIMNKFKKAYSSIAHMMKGKPTPRKERREAPEPEEPPAAPARAQTRAVGYGYYVPTGSWYTISGSTYSGTILPADFHMIAAWAGDKKQAPKKRTITNRLKGLG